MKSWRQKGLEEAQKQKYLDEIHVKPDVKRTFVICEWFVSFDWISNLVFFVTFTIGIWMGSPSDMANAKDLVDIIYTLLDKVGGYYGLGAFLIVKTIVGYFKKKYQAKLQVFEDAGVIEIEKQIADGTYQKGPTVSKAYRIFRGVRTWSIILTFVALIIGAIPYFIK
ncbi:MAG: hypothetical protein IKC47_02920 [Clostridia bacterium]|nr:hypothetical protein [Clostridia bacterium]